MTAISLCLFSANGMCEAQKTAEKKNEKNNQALAVKTPVPSLAFLTYLAELEETEQGWVSPVDMATLVSEESIENKSTAKQKPPKKKEDN